MIVGVAVGGFRGVFMGVPVACQMHIELGARDAALVGAEGVEMVTIQPELSQLDLEPVKIDTRIDQGADEHVAADAAEEIQVEGVHFLRGTVGFVQGFSGMASPVPAARALIWLAAYPAPKPLSMLTTVTPLPQLLSMPRSAANPPKCAP